MPIHEGDMNGSDAPTLLGDNWHDPFTSILAASQELLTKALGLVLVF